MISPNGPQKLAERLIAATDWTKYRSLGRDTAEDVGEALVALLSSSKDTVEAIRDRIETQVAVQANLYSAAEPVTRILALSLVEDRSRWVRIPVLDLLFLILSGASAPEEKERGEVHLQNRCVEAARESLWSLVRVAEEDPNCLDAVLDVLQLIDPEGHSARLLNPNGGGA